LKSFLERCLVLCGKFGQYESAPIIILVVIGLFHRLFLFAYYFDEVALMVRNNPDWLTWQYLKVPALSDYLADSLIYLQQTPPLPQLFLGASLKVFSWPDQVSYFLILTNGLISIIAAVLLYRLGFRLTKMKILSLATALLFLLSADLVVIEYNGLGQTIYENCCMIWILLFVMGGVQLLGGNSVRAVVMMSVSTALLIMTRSAYTYFFLVPLILLLAVRPAPFGKCLGIFAVIWIGTHGAWAIKNYLVYDRLSLSTSTWQGANLAKGLVSTGFEQPFREYILTKDFGAPSWFLDYIRADTNIPVWGAKSWRGLPRPVRQKSRTIDERLKGTNRRENSVAFAEYVRQFEPAYVGFALENPAIIALKISRSYELFWAPIRYYGGMYLSLFEVDWVIRRPLDVSRIMQLWITGRLPEDQRIITGKQGNFETRPATLFTVDMFAPLMAILALLAVHLFLPWQSVKEAWLLVRDRTITAGTLTYLNLVLVMGYSFIVFVLVEHGENMRFRLSVEPLIWLCILLMLAASATAARCLINRRKQTIRNGIA